MDTIEKYGIILRRMAVCDMETVRAWRNDPEILKCMFSQKTISAAEQLDWFDRINNEENLYFIIEEAGVPAGQVSLVKIDRGTRCAESGILVCANRQGRGLAYKAMAAILDEAFYSLKLALVTALVRSDNHRAQKFHEELGYKEIARHAGVVTFTVNAEHYEHKKRELLERWQLT